MPSGISPISSRKSVPPSASSTLPMVCLMAPVNAPFSYPKSSDSRSVSVRAAQDIATNGLPLLGLSAWIARARSSLPVPLSPRTSTVDALRAAEASLTARAEARQQAFGRSWEDVARLIVAIRDKADPQGIDCRVTWADAATRSIAQEADAVVKLYTAGLLSRPYALRRLGYDDADVADTGNTDPISTYTEGIAR